MKYGADTARTKGAQPRGSQVPLAVAVVKFTSRDQKVEDIIDLTIARLETVSYEEKKR